MKINGFDFNFQPSLSLTLQEFPSTIRMAIMCFFAFPGMLWEATWEKSEWKHPIVFVPGFGAHDATTLPFRIQAWWRHHHPISSGLGVNLGVDDDVAAVFFRNMVRSFNYHKRPMIFVGHSLGGAISNVFAHRYPEMCHMVFTLASPHKIPKGNVLVKKLIEMISGTEHLRNNRLQAMIENPSSVPTVAFTATNDGFLPSDCTRVKETDHSRNIEVPGSHCGLIISPVVWREIFASIQEPGISYEEKMEKKRNFVKKFGLQKSDYDWAWC